MSFINYHRSPKIIERATPAFVRGYQWPNQVTTNYTVTAPLQAVQGNFLIILITGNNTRNYTASPASVGWTLVNKINTPVLCHAWYKFAGASEPLVVPITFDSSLTGGVAYYEFTNIDPGNPYLASGSFNNGAALSHVCPAFNLLKSKSLVMYDIALAVATTTWVVDNSVTAYNIALNTIRKDGFRVYTDFTHDSQITTWSSPSDNRVGVGSWSIFNGKPVNYA